MFENSLLVSAIIRDMKRNLDEVDRRAFYGPDVPEIPETPRRKGRVARLFRRQPHIG